MIDRKDSEIVTEVLVLEDFRIFRNCQSIDEYFSNRNQLLSEFINPNLSYSYSIKDINGGYLFDVEQVEDDPSFVVTLKPNGKMFVLDFYWPSSQDGFSRLNSIKGKHYLDTLAKIVRDELPDILDKSNEEGVVFMAYNVDSGGNKRKSLFKRLIDGFVNKEKFTILDKEDLFIIKKKNGK